MGVLEYWLYGETLLDYDHNISQLWNWTDTFQHHSSPTHLPTQPPTGWQLFLEQPFPPSQSDKRCTFQSTIIFTVSLCNANLKFKYRNLNIKI